MTDSQIIAIAITVLAVLGGTIVNNSRIGDLHKRIDDTKEVLRAEMQLGFARIDHKLDEILTILGQHNSRIEALEQRLPPR